MSPYSSILIIGGGAAGMLAAIVAARRGARVTVADRMQKVGRKLLATGNGRCNLTNTHPELAHYHGRDTSFARTALEAFDARKTLDFFAELGIETRTDADGKVFPTTDQAAAVLDVLRLEMEALGVEVIPDCKVQTVQRRGQGFTCACSDGQELTADRIILATGGQSSPNLGSNGGGFKIAQALGHTLAQPMPSLVQIKLDAPFLKRLKGVRVDGAASILIETQVRRSDRGELLFTDYGISGIPVMNLSRIVSEHMERLDRVTLALDLFEGSTAEELADNIQRRVERRPERPLEESLIGLMHKRLIPVVVREAGLADPRMACSEIDAKAIAAIAGLLKDWRIACAGTLSWMHSQVTAGGVSTDEVDPATMQSRRVPGLYFAGEVLDIDGDCGGYNLQWAWSSAYVAAMAAASEAC